MVTVDFSFDVGAYRIRIARTADDVASSLRLRSEVFLGEFSAAPRTGSETVDEDEFDADCDHLIISLANDPEVIASYRLRLHTSPESKCYTDGEFDLSNFLRRPERKLELGRACVSPRHRNGIVLRLLWRGIYEYAVRTDADVFFGCSSLTAGEIPAWHEILKMAELTESLLPPGQFRARPKYAIENHPVILDILKEKPAITTKVSSLLSLYLLAGAKISDSLAYDADFGCVDIFTLLHISDLPSQFRRPLSREK